jgi:hypothetical protein
MRAKKKKGKKELEDFDSKLRARFRSRESISATKGSSDKIKQK